MAIGIDDLDDFDDVMYSQEEPSSSTTQVEDSNDDYISDYLKTRGIEDSSKIKFEEDDGSIIERNWKDLSKEEKLNILNTPLDVEKPQQVSNNLDISDEEINLLNTIRQSNLTPSEYLNQLKEEPQEPVYKIDDLSDDEIYLLDLESRVGEISDEEAANALNLAKQNEDFYKKQVEGIRKEYKEREDFQSQSEQAQIEEQQRIAFEQYQNNIVNAINGFNSIGNLDLDLEDNDKEELAEFILSQDEQGTNYLWQALQDPETLTRVAWFILNGEEAFNNISDYFTNQIKLISENQYKKGLEEGKKGNTTKPSLVIKQNNNQSKSYTSIDDLDD